MDMELNGDQQMLVDAVRTLGAKWRDMPMGHERDYSHFAADLQDALDVHGFMRAGVDWGMLEAALVVLEISQLPVVTSAGASALVAPALLGGTLDDPIALLSGDLGKAQRLLPVAHHGLAERKGQAVLLDLSGMVVEPVESIFAYPYGRFVTVPDMSVARPVGDAARLRQWHRVAIAVECAGAAKAAITLTVQHVKDRMVFGRPVGSFQAVQHRLAQCHQIACAMRMLALYAAWSGEAVAADIAATYAQDHVGKLAFDLHQFNGGMGVTAEHKLHFFTYRLRALQAELGGADAAAGAVYDALWNRAA